MEISHNKIISSDFHDNFNYWTESIADFHTEICGTKINYCRQQPLFASKETDCDESDDRVPRGDAHLLVYHRMETELSDVGQQIWNSSLILVDWIIGNQIDFTDKTVLELGCGVGLVSMVTGGFCRVVIATDSNETSLQMCRFNVRANRISNVRVKLLDWNDDIDFRDNRSMDIAAISNVDRFDGNESEIAMGKIDWIIANDVIYDDDITDAFMRTIYGALSANRGATAVIFGQKRFIWSYDNRQVSPHFDHFIDCLTQLNEFEIDNERLKFVAREIDVDRIDQYVEYRERPTNVFAYRINLENY